MHCLVGVKRVLDFNVKPRVKPDKSGVDTTGLKMSMNPFDEIALEEAVRLKEKGIVTDITAVSIGTMASVETCRVALARGADRAYLVETEESLEPIHIATIFKTLIQEVLEPQLTLVLLGKQAIDDDCNQTGQMLSALLGWSQGTFVSKISIEREAEEIEVAREVDIGLETLALKLPAVVTVDLRLNTPRYISLRDVMRSKSKPLTRVSLEDLKRDFKLSIKPHLKTLCVEEPPLKRPGIKVGSVQELISKLRNEVKVIP